MEVRTTRVIHFSPLCFHCCRRGRLLFAKHPLALCLSSLVPKHQQNRKGKGREKEQKQEETKKPPTNGTRRSRRARPSPCSSLTTAPPSWCSPFVRRQWAKGKIKTATRKKTNQCDDAGRRPKAFPFGGGGALCSLTPLSSSSSCPFFSPSSENKKKNKNKKENMT